MNLPATIALNLKEGEIRAGDLSFAHFSIGSTTQGFALPADLRELININQ